MSLRDGAEFSKLPVSADTTVKELAEEYGFEAMRRGLQYMDSLSDAEQEYIDSASGEKMERGYRDAGVEGGEEQVKHASSKWADKMKESGIGIEEDE